MAHTYIYGDNYINDYVVLTLAEFNYKITNEYKIVVFEKLSKIITDVYDANNKLNANISKYLKFDIVDINNVDEVAEKIDIVLKETSIARQMGENAYLKAKEFSFEKVSHGFIAAIQGSLENADNNE